jgi:hypothetical protein
MVHYAMVQQRLCLKVFQHIQIRVAIGKHLHVCDLVNKFFYKGHGGQTWYYSILYCSNCNKNIDETWGRIRYQI